MRHGVVAHVYGDGPGDAWIADPGGVDRRGSNAWAIVPPRGFETGSPAARYGIIKSGPDGLGTGLLGLSCLHEGAAMQAEKNGHPDVSLALRTGFVRTDRPS